MDVVGRIFLVAGTDLHAITGVDDYSRFCVCARLRQYLEAFGARLELVAVFDDEERRVRFHLGKEDPAA